MQPGAVQAGRGQERDALGRRPGRDSSERREGVPVLTGERRGAAGRFLSEGNTDC